MTHDPNRTRRRQYTQTKERPWLAYLLGQSGQVHQQDGQAPLVATRTTTRGNFRESNTDTAQPKILSSSNGRGGGGEGGQNELLYLREGKRGNRVNMVRMAFRELSHASTQRNVQRTKNKEGDQPTNGKRQKRG